jgi:branched-chain amino acid transport system permease protein
MIHRESGVFKTSYIADMAVFPLPIAQWTVAALTVTFVVVVPAAFSEYHLSIVNLIMIAVVGALGLNILVGCTGQISVGHGALMSVGAYTAANLITRLNAPFWVALPAGGAMAAAIGAVIGVPSLRIKGLYLAIATLAGQLIIEWVINHVPWISGGVQASIEVPRPSLFGVRNSSSISYFCFLRCSQSPLRSTLCAAASGGLSSRSATKTSQLRSLESTSFATSSLRLPCLHSTPA